MPALQGFIGQSYVSRSKAIDSQECINLYPEIEQQSSKNVVALLGTPGLSTFATITSSVGFGGRGIHYSSATNRFFVAVGNFFSEIATDGTVTDHSALDTYSGDVRFAENAIGEILIVDGLNGYIFDTTTNTFTTIDRSGNGSGFPANPTHCGFIAGYFIVNQGGSGNFFWSSLDSASSSAGGLYWSALDFGNAEGSPDDLKGLIVNRNELWLIGSSSKEVWVITGSSSSSGRFQFYQGTLRNKGTDAGASIQNIHDKVFYLGSNQEGYGIVWMSEGYEMVRVSTPAIEYAIRGYSDISDAIGFAYQIEGHVFYVLSFPTGDETWVFDVSTGMWHKWAYWDSAKAKYRRAKAVYQGFFNGNNYVLDTEDKFVYELSSDIYSDNGDEIRRVRSSPHVHAGRKRLFYNSFELDMEFGVGLADGQGDDPQAMLQISDDGGFTWGNEMWTSIGKIGERDKKVDWNRLGFSRNRVFKVAISDPIKVVMINAFINVEIEQ